MSKFFKSMFLLLSAGLFTATSWAATLELDANTGLPTDANYETGTIFSSVSSAIDKSGSHIKLSANGNQSINGAITAASVYIEKPRWQIDFNKTVNLQNAGAIYVKGQLFAQTWTSSSGTGSITLANNFFIAPNTTTDTSYGTIRVGDEGNLTLTGTVTILPNASTVTIGGGHKGGKMLTLSALDLSQLASIEERASAALTIGGNLKCSFSEGATINLPADCTGTVKVIAMGTGALSGFDSTHITVTCGGVALPNGYAAIFNEDGTVQIKDNTTFIDGAIFSTTAQDGTSKMSWSMLEGVDNTLEYVNTTLAIHFTEDNQTFTFDNTSRVALTSLTVTAEEGVTGATIELPATEDLVIATASTINADVTVTGKGALGAVTVANTKTLTLNGPVATSVAGQGKLVKAGSDEWTLNAQDWSNANGLSMEIRGGSVILPNDFNVATPLTIMGGTAEAPISLTQYNSNKSFGSVTIKENSFLELHVNDNTKVNVTGENADTSFVSLIADDDGGWGVTEDATNTKVSGITLKVTRKTPTANANIEFWHERSSFLNDASCNLIIDDGIDFRLSGVPLSVRNLSGVGDIMNGTNAVTVAPASACQYEGVIRSNAPLTVNGSAPLTLTQAHLSTAKMTVNGQLIFTNSGSWTGAIEVGDQGVLTYNRTLTPTNTITNNGTITADTATVDLTGATISGSGTYGVTNGGTLILKAGTENGASVTSGTLKLLLSEENIVKGYTANVANDTTVTFVVAGDVDGDGDGYDTLIEGVDGNEYAAPMNVWTPSEDATWANTVNWSNGALPSNTDNVEIRITGDTELELPSDVTVAALRVTGTGTLSITGGKLTASYLDAQANISAGDTTLALVQMTISENVSVTYNTTANAVMPAMMGLGNFVKTGAAKLTLGNTTACEATIDVTEGTLELNSGATYDKVYHFIAREGATIDIASAHVHMPSTESEITLKGNAKLKLQNGNASSNRHIGAKILINESSVVKPAIIVGSYYGDNTNLTGGITGSGLLEIRSEHANSFTISGAIKDQENAQLAVKVATTAGVTFSGANTYTGGTDIAAGATLTITNKNALGTQGNITGAGTLECKGNNTTNDDFNNNQFPANKNGLTTGGWTGTVRFKDLENFKAFTPSLYGNEGSKIELYNVGSENGEQFYFNGSGAYLADYDLELIISGKNYLRNGNENSKNCFKKVTGTGELVVANKPTNGHALIFEDASGFEGNLTIDHAKHRILLGDNDANLLSDGQIVIAGTAVINQDKTFEATNGVTVTSTGTLSGTGMIDCALSFDDNATIDTTGGAVKVTGAVTLPSALTVKIAAAPAVGTAVPLLNASNVTIPEGMDVTVMVGDTPVEGTYQLIKTATGLFLDNVPADDLEIVASNIGAAQLYEANQMGNYDSYGVQVDLDGATPYAPGWVAGAHYPLTSFAVVHDSVGSVAVGTCVQVVDADNPSVVVATSAPLQTEDKESVPVTSSNTTNNYTLCTFKFEAPVYVDAAKTYQFRFVNGEGTAVTCKIRALYTSDANGGGDNQRYCNWLNAQYEVITAVATRYVPYTVLTVERVIDNSPILSGDDETLPVDTVPEKIRLNTATFGYGLHTVLRYTGDGTPDWDDMYVEGLPAGVTKDDIDIDEENQTWGFVNNRLNVLPIGDSITAGLVRYYGDTSAGWHVAGGYRLPLYQFLKQADYDVNYMGTSLYSTSLTGDSATSNSCEDRDIDSKILADAGLLHHEGHSGATLNQLYDRFKKANVQAILAGQGTPDVITLHLGTNDFGLQRPADSAEDAFAEMKQLLYLLNGAADDKYTSEDTPLYPNATIFVAKIIPRSDDSLMEKITSFNAMLTGYVTTVAKRTPGKLVLVDLNMDTSYQLLRHDRLHPSTEGYSRMAQNWFANIEAVLPPMGAEASIATVDARVADTLTVTTNKAIDTSLTQTWTLNNDATVTAAKIADDKRTVTLTVKGVAANTYTLTATNLFAAEDSVTKTFTTTADIHTPKTDVTETTASDTSNSSGVLKAAEWTTFAGFVKGSAYTSPIGYMPESGRAWKLESTTATADDDGVLSLNGTPLTVNFVDGHIGHTSAPYTVVMTVSNLSKGDVLITESMAQYTNNGSVEGTPGGTNAADAIQLKVKDTDTNTLVWGTTEIPVGVDLTDDKPDTIALSGKWVNGDNYSVAVNGGAKTALSVSGASQTIRGSWSIGALSEADTGSSMKLYRLSFYEGEATVVMPSEITTATINVGEGDGQYITWATAKEALKLSDEMESLTINFTAEDQTFTFDEAVTIDAVMVQGTAGGTIANAGTATVTATNLAINTNVTMNDDAMALTGDVNVATGCVLTYNVGDGMTVNATHTGSGSIAVTNAGVYNGGELEITKTCSVNVAVNDSASLVVNVAPAFNGNNFTKALADNITVSGEGSVVLQQGIAYANVNVAYVDVDGTYYLGIGGTAQNPVGSFTPAMLYVGEDGALKVRAYRDYSLTVNTVYVEGVIEKDGGNVTPTMTVTADGGVTSYFGEGQINLTLILEEGVLLEGATGLTVQNLQLPNTLKIDESALPTVETPVVLFKTTAFAEAQGQVEGVTLMVNDQATEDYLLYKTAEALELRYAPWTTMPEVTASGAVDSWSELLADMEAKRQRFDTSEGKTPSLIIDFGNGTTPGTFTFDLEDATALSLTKVTIQGTNGGTIQKSGTANVTATATVVNTNVEIAENAMLLGQTTLAANCILTVNDANALGEAANFAADATSTVKLVNVDKNTLNLGKLVPNGSNLILKNVKAYIFDCTIGTLTLEGDFQMVNGTTTKSKTQCVTVNNLVGAGTFKVADGDAYCTAINAKTWTGFTGSIDIGYSDSQNTIVFLGEAPDRFTTSITPGDVGADDSDFTEADYGTIYVTEGNLVTAVGSTWKAPKIDVAAETSLTIQGWFGASKSIAVGSNASMTVGGVTDGENVVEAGVLDLRTLTDAQLEAISVTVKAGGRLLVNTGATVPDNITFETGSILGVATKHVEDVGNATLTVTVGSNAKDNAIFKGYHTDGVTELDNWSDPIVDDNEDLSLDFTFDPVFDGELCWWAYEFDTDENTTNTTKETEKIGPMSSGRDKTRMEFDRHNDSNRHCESDEYVDHEDGTKAIRMASGPYRSASYPKAFTLAMYGTVTGQPNRVLFGVGSTSSGTDKYAVVLATGASANEVQLVLVQGHKGSNDNYPENPVRTLAVTTVPNAATENHLYSFSYEQFDSNADKTLDSTRIIFYVDGEKYQPFTVNALIPLGGGFQMGTTHGGCPPGLTRMNEEDRDATMEFLRIYDQILPENVLTAMSNEYSYMSKNGRATRTIVAGQDATWNEGTEWTQIRAVKNDEGGYELDSEGHVTFDNGTAVEKPDHGQATGTQVVLDVSGENTLYLNEFYSTTTDPETGASTTTGNAKLYYERLEINPVNQSGDSLTLWAGRNNENETAENKTKQSAVITVQGYTKINTNVTMAHNVAFLSGPVAVAEGKYLRFDFSGFDVMKVPSLPVTYRLTGFLDEETRERVTSTAPADPVNARSIDLGYKTTVNQYTFTVNRYPVTAYFTADDDPMVAAHNNDTTIDFNELYYIWQGNEMGKQMNWAAEAVNPQGQPIVENTLAKFVSLDTETQQEKMVTVTLATNDVDPITLTLDEEALKKETTPAGTDGEGNPTEAVVESMLGAEQLIVGNKVTVDYTGDDVSELAPFVKDVVGMLKAKAMTATTWRGNLTLDNGEDAVAIAGANTISGKLVLGKSITLATGATISAKDADFTAVKTITVDYEEAVAAGTYKVVGLAAGHTAKSLIGCSVIAVKDDTSTVEWTEAEGTLVVVRADGLYVVARPDVTVTTNETTKVIKNEDLTLPLARRAAELSATSVSLTGVVNMAGKEVDAPVADAAEVFTNVAFDMTETPVDGVVTAKLKYDFGVSQINVVTIESVQYVVAELIVSNAAELANNSADYADGVTVDVVVKKGEDTQTLTMTPVADMTGAETMPATVEKAKRYIRFPMPDGNGTFEIKARAAKKAAQQQ